MICLHAAVFLALAFFSMLAGLALAALFSKDRKP